MKILHILNGESTQKSFEDTGLEGDMMVWNEVLSEGPVEENISSAHFWKARSNWICDAFGENSDGYQLKVLDELTKLDGNYDEINLWFEFDLHCQANLLGVMAYLKKQTDLSAPAIYLICPDAFPGKGNFRGMGELTGEELEYLFDSIRLQLSGMDFIIAAEAWEVYTAKDAGILNRYLAGNQFWGSLHLLKPALAAQINRLTVNDQGLNYIEQRLLAIYSSGINDKHSLCNAFWETEKIYGMGDMEIDLYLKSLNHKGLIGI